jgi:hypothetical protein
MPPCAEMERGCRGRYCAKRVAFGRIVLVEAIAASMRAVAFSPLLTVRRVDLSIYFKCGLTQSSATSC